ncbi:MAG: glycoside hydrolase family 5 protein [Planctomycetota bacterium]|nr:MAG: glycoside hydrolase family 5 protein [Planctomycetota bacterium]
MASDQRLSRREFGMVAVVGTTAFCSWSAPRKQSQSPAPPRWNIRGGVSLAGAEFGATKPSFSNQNPGTYGRDYIYPDQPTIRYFAQHGLGILRIPFRWERLQPRLGQPLDPDELNRIREVVEWAADAGAAVVLDTHNYGRYTLQLGGKPKSVVIGERIGRTAPVSSALFADYWRRIAQAFAHDPTILGFGLMNEPHDMGHSSWQAISQQAVEAIRTVNRETSVIVAGDGWSNARRFPESNGPRAWINDPADRVLYEAHSYFDSDGTGRYARSYAEELREDPDLVQRGVKRIGVFCDWCRQNNVRGFLGEFGIPGQSAGWRRVMDHTLEWLHATDLLACYWAAGQWWHDYPLSVQPTDEMRRPAPQLAILRRWLVPQVES